MTHDPDTSARMAQHFERLNRMERNVQRCNVVAVVLLLAALVAVLATVLALLT